MPLMHRRGAVMAIGIVLLVLTDRILHNQTPMSYSPCRKIVSQTWSYMAIVAVMLSSIGTLETSILQFTRTMYAKGRDGVLHPR